MYYSNLQEIRTTKDTPYERQLELIGFFPFGAQQI